MRFTLTAWFAICCAAIGLFAPVVAGEALPAEPLPAPPPALDASPVPPKPSEPSEPAAEAESGPFDDKLIAAWESEEMKAVDGVPMEKLSFPIDHFSDGTVRAQFYADRALIPNDENAFVRADGVRIELYDERGKVVGYYIADHSIFDRVTRVGYSEGKVRIEYWAPVRNIRIDGRNMQWNLATRDAKILVDPVVTMAPVMQELEGAFK